MNSKINIGIVEDQLLFREGIKAILSNWKEFEVIFESADGFSVINKLNHAALLPDIMLIDLSLPAYNKIEYSGLHLTLELVKCFPQIKVLILSVHDDDNFMAELIKSGAHGYLVKNCDPSELHEAILSIFDKGSYINLRVLKAIQDKLTKKIPLANKGINFISPREEEVLKLTCQQLTADEIAEKLFISVKTVNGHRNNLLAKTGSRNVTGLVTFAIKNNIIQL